MIQRSCMHEECQIQNLEDIKSAKSSSLHADGSYPRDPGEHPQEPFESGFFIPKKLPVCNHKAAQNHLLTPDRPVLTPRLVLDPSSPKRMAFEVWADSKRLVRMQRMFVWMFFFNYRLPWSLYLQKVYG